MCVTHGTDVYVPQVLLCPEKSRPQENKDKVLLGYTYMVDAWAMGILAYELIVGRPPFEKQSRAATYEHIMYRKPDFPATMSPHAKDFVFSALTKVLILCRSSKLTLVLLCSRPWCCYLADSDHVAVPQSLAICAKQILGIMLCWCTRHPCCRL